MLLLAVSFTLMSLVDSGGGAGGIVVPPTPVPTPNGVQVTANLTVMRCLNYRRIVTYWLDMEMSPSDEFLHLSDEHIPIIMSIMAKESACDEDVTDGLMQVIPRDWLPDSRSNRMNVYVGMSIFDGCLRLSGGDVELALAYYNCGVPKVERNACGTRGGMNYAADVLNFWLPLFMEAEARQSVNQPTSEPLLP